MDFRVRTSHKIEARWADGIYLGIKRTSTEKLIGTADRVYVVQSIRRKPVEYVWNGQLLLSIKGTPWCPNPKAEDRTELILPISLEPELPDAPKGLAPIKGTPCP